MKEPAHIGLHEVKQQLGLGETGLQRFLEATKLQVFDLPGGGRVVSREMLNKAVDSFMRDQSK